MATVLVRGRGEGVHGLAVGLSGLGQADAGLKGAQGVHGICSQHAVDTARREAPQSQVELRGANVEVGYLTRVEGLESGAKLRVVVIPLKVSSVVSPGEGGPILRLQVTGETGGLEEGTEGVELRVLGIRSWRRPWSRRLCKAGENAVFAEDLGETPGSALEGGQRVESKGLLQKGVLGCAISGDVSGGRAADVGVRPVVDSTGMHVKSVALEANNGTAVGEKSTTGGFDMQDCPDIGQRNVERGSRQHSQQRS